MAVRISSSKFLESAVAKDAAVEVANTVLPDAGGPLPVGIKGGVARLTEIYFENDEKYKEGFRAEAEIELPVAFDGQYIKGKKTRQWITFNAENLAERITRIGLILKALGGDAIIGDGKNVNFIKIVDFLQTVTKKAPIYFAFSTSAKQSGEWPWENWHKAIPGFSPLGTGPAEPQKKTEPAVNGNITTGNNPKHHQESFSTNGSGSTFQKVDPAPWSERASGAGYQSVAVPDAGAGAATDVYDDAGDVDSLIARAVAKDNDAMDKLDEFAKALGYTQEDLDEAPDYAMIGGWVKSGNPKSISSVDVPINKRTITINQVYTYAPPGKREGQRLKDRECRVISVDDGKRVAQIQDLVKKELFDVGYDDENLK